MRRCAHVLIIWMFSWLVFACDGTPTGPGQTTLQTGRWTGDGACLSIAEEQCNLTVGCGHGQFPRPILDADGTFEVDGTYRIEVGPVRIDPAPAAHFSGVLVGSTLLLKVTPIGDSPPAASYRMKRTSSGSCAVPCV